MENAMQEMYNLGEKLSDSPNDLKILLPFSKQ